MEYYLGLSAFYHDSAAVLITDNEIIAGAQEERFTRKKFDRSFPSESIKFCLDYANISLEQIKCIGFYENPRLKFERLIETFFRYSKNPIKNFSEIVDWFNQKFYIENIINKELQTYNKNIYFYNHHLSHAASAFFPSPFDEATIVTIDGVGEWSCTSIAHGFKNKIRIIKEQRYPNSLGLLYSAFTQFLGFKVDSGEYKVMGLAPYGNPLYLSLIKEKICKISNEGVISVNTDYFDFMIGSSMISNKFEKLFNHKRRFPDEKLNQFHFDIASSIQKFTEEAILKIVAYSVNLTNCKNLVLAGGVALNCVANGKIIENRLINKIWIQPAAGDAGGALGAALLCSFHTHSNERKIISPDLQNQSLLGPSFSNAYIKKTLDTFEFKYQELNKKNRDNVIVSYLKNGNVIGYFSGRMEFGPRALGARSILADPRDPNMLSKVNQKIKFRESFRPLAPIVLSERVKAYFKNVAYSPYMLLVDKINIQDNENGSLKFPSITHIDKSVRIQTIDKNSNIYSLLKEFENQTGCPMLINTSFNIRGEPIVCSPYDALLCFMNTNIDCLIIENFLLVKKDQKRQLVSKDFLNYIKED